MVLSRSVNEQLVLGPFKDEDGNDFVVTITNVETRGQKVRLGVEAPRHVGVNRREVYEGKVAQGALPAVTVATKVKTNEA